MVNEGSTDMDELLAKRLVPLVNDLDFFSELQVYVDHRINTLHKELENSELVRVDKIQGQLVELRKLSKLRDEVLAKAK